VSRAADLPSQAYAAAVASGRISRDAGQLGALAELDRVQRALLARERRGWWQRLRARIAGGERPLRGLYLWGEVGRGKTFLVDLFYEHLAGVPKRRVHFHRFMGEVHARLRAQGERSDPLALVATELADGCRLLCLDEFFVTDIGDAMILARLLEGLFAAGVVLVTTSNTPPADLYREGLQRARFLPAIALLERHCVVHRLASPTDWRLRALEQAPVFHLAAGAEAAALLGAIWARLTQGAAPIAGAIEANGRDIPARACHEGIAWFGFDALCEGPRAVADYIELARDFHTLLLQGIPRFDGGNDDPARRFVHLVDELYDRNVNLIASAAAAPTALYSGERLRLEFQRTASRLVEMQSHAYLARPHRP
jgi:cell division protein ZapE